MIAPTPDDEVAMDATRAPLMDHLIELRKRLIWSIITFIACFLISFIFAKPIYGFLTQPLAAALQGVDVRGFLAGAAATKNEGALGAVLALTGDFLGLAIVSSLARLFVYGLSIAGLPASRGRAGIVAVHAMAAAHETIAARASAGCSGIMVVIDDQSVRIGSVGALVALIFRAGQIIHRTVPHLDLNPQMNVVSRSLGPGENPAVDISGPWPVVHGDLVLLCSRKIHEVLAERDLLTLANRDSETVIVRGILTTAASRGEFAELFAMAIRVVA